MCACGVMENVADYRASRQGSIPAGGTTSWKAVVRFQLIAKFFTQTLYLHSLHLEMFTLLQFWKYNLGFYFWENPIFFRLTEFSCKPTKIYAEK